MKYERSSDGSLRKKKTSYTPLHKAYRAGDAVKIQFGPTKCKFLTPYPAGVYHALEVYVPGHIFIPAVKNGHWDGKHRFITKPGYFQTGLLPVIHTMLTQGINPLLDEDHRDRNVLLKPVENVEVIVPDKYKKIYYPGLVNYYENHLDILQWLNPEEGLFIYPKELLREWGTVKRTNPLARQVLLLAKDLKASS